MLLNYGVTTFTKQLKVPEYQLTRMFNERPICGITLHLLDRVTSDLGDHVLYLVRHLLIEKCLFVLCYFI